MQLPKLDKQQVLNLLTGILVLVWIGTLVARAWIDWEEAKILDGFMGLIIPYWFAQTAVNTARKNGNGANV